jgi:hypothetical protein
VTSRPRGKCRSIFLTGGVVNGFLRIEASSIVLGEVLSFLQALEQQCKTVEVRAAYHPVFCVSGATAILTPSFSAGGRQPCYSCEQGHMTYQARRCS